MEVKLSTKKILLSIIDECDLILREFLNVLTSKEATTNPIKLLDILLDKDTELKKLIPKVNEQIRMQRFMDYLKSEIEKRDKMILSCQLHLKKSEIILNTAIYYSRKKLNVISTAVANPVDPEEVIKYGHKITAGHGVVAPNDWLVGDKRRPFPTEENIRNGYLGMVDNVTGEWNPNFVDYVAANQESRLNVIFGLTQPPAQKEGTIQPPPSPLQSPRITNRQPAPPQIIESVVHSSSSASSLNLLPPGVNVVSSPAASTNRGISLPIATGSSSGTPTDHSRNMIQAPAAVTRIQQQQQQQQQQQDDVEVMTDSCSSSSSDGF